MFHRRRLSGRGPIGGARAVHGSGLVFDLVQSALGKIEGDSTNAASLLTQAARSDLTRDLERLLLRILRPALSTRIELTVPVDKSRYSPERSSSPQLILNIAALRLQEVFALLPGAKQTVETVVHDWVGARRVMLRRLERDWTQVLSMLRHPAKRCINHLATGLSDPHDRGQTVTTLDFTGGGRVVYKPRSCEAERIWFAALKWLNREGFQPSFYIPELISRRNYCWMSFVQHRPCRSKRAVRDFYFRWGAQAAVAQLLGCGDLHRQNWVASGEQPVLVDAEMLGFAFAAKGTERTRERQLHPLLRTGLVPLFKEDNAGYYSRIAPFDSVGNTDERNIFWPVYQGRSRLPRTYVDALVEGFLAASGFICACCRTQSFERFVRRAVTRRKPRVLKRATEQYRRILDASLQPVHLRKHGDRLKFLMNRCGDGQIGRVEAGCLFRCSVPRVTAHTNTNAGRRRRLPTFDAMSESAEWLRSRILATRRIRKITVLA